MLTDAEWRRKWDLEDMERGRSILSEEEHRRRMGEALAAASLRAAQGRQDVEAEMAKNRVAELKQQDYDRRYDELIFNQTQ